MTTDPTGLWNRRQILLENDPNYPDHPLVGFNKDWIAVTLDFTGNSNFTRLYVFDKASLYASNSPTPTVFVASGGCICPVRTYDNTLTNLYLIQDYNGDTNSMGYLRVLEINGPTNSPALSVLSKFPSTSQTWTNTYRNPLADNLAPQKDITNRIHTLDSRIPSALYRNGYIWCVQTVFLPASNATRCSVQWWKIRPNEIVAQRGLIDDPGGTNFYAYPSIAVNRFNDVLIGYSRFSANQYASANYSFRAFYDPPCTLRTDRVLKAGEGPYLSTSGFSGLNRWGDYSATVVDPVNDADLWTIQEYAATNVGTGLEEGDGRWGTWWGKIKVELPANDAFNAAQTISGSQGSTTGAPPNKPANPTMRAMPAARRSGSTGPPPTPCRHALTPWAVLSIPCWLSTLGAASRTLRWWPATTIPAVIPGAS